MQHEIMATESMVALNQFMSDPRIGWPPFDESITPNLHGWFRRGNQETLEHLIKPSFKCIVELGSWLGKSTTRILDLAPNALVFAVDLWENQYFIDDTHYNKSDPVFSNILNGVSIYHQFLANTKQYKVRQEVDGSYRGLIPMRMNSTEALTLLFALGVQPDLIYIDASHHYDFVVADVTMCLKYFPGAMLVGDDWDNPDVKRAVEDVAAAFGLTDLLVVHRWTCWTFERDKMRSLIVAADLERKRKEKKKTRRRRPPQKHVPITKHKRGPITGRNKKHRHKLLK